MPTLLAKVKAMREMLERSFFIFSVFTTRLTMRGTRGEVSFCKGDQIDGREGDWQLLLKTTSTPFTSPPASSLGPTTPAPTPRAGVIRLGRFKKMFDIVRCEGIYQASRVYKSFRAYRLQGSSTVEHASPPFFRERLTKSAIELFELVQIETFQAKLNCARNIDGMVRIPFILEVEGVITRWVWTYENMTSGSRTSGGVSSCVRISMIMGGLWSTRCAAATIKSVIVCS